MEIEIIDLSETENIVINRPKLNEIFTPDNTEWEDDCGEQHLVYKGCLDDLADETGYTEDQLYQALGDYEDDSRDLIEHQREIEEARKGQY